MKQQFKQFVSNLNQEIDRTTGAAKAQVERVRLYLESDQFEAHLDEFAAQVGLDWGGLVPAKSDNCKIRIAAKSARVVHYCRGQLGATAVASAGFAASIAKSPQFIAGVAAACTGGLGLYYLWIAADIVTQNRTETAT